MRHVLSNVQTKKCSHITTANFHWPFTQQSQWTACSLLRLMFRLSIGESRNNETQNNFKLASKFSSSSAPIFWQYFHGLMASYIKKVRMSCCKTRLWCLILEFIIAKCWCWWSVANWCTRQKEEGRKEERLRNLESSYRELRMIRGETLSRDGSQSCHWPWKRGSALNIKDFKSESTISYHTMSPAILR